MPGLTKAQAIAYVQQGLSFRSDRSAEIALQFSLSQYDELEAGGTLPWFLVKRDVVLAGLANVGSIPLPVDFIRSVDDEGFYWLYPGGGRKYLTKKPMDWVISFNQEGATIDNVEIPQDPVTLPPGIPSYYALNSDNTIFVMPIPVTNFSLYATYYAHDVDFAVVSPAAQNQWLKYAGSLISNLVGTHLAEDLQDQEAFTKFTARYKIQQLRLFNETVMRETSDAELSMGDLS